MNDFDRWRRLRRAAVAVRIGACVLLTLLSAPGSFLSGPVGDADAQQPPAGRVYRIGFLSQGQPPKAFLEALQQGLRERGYVEGRNLIWEFRSTDGSLEQLPRFAEEHPGSSFVGRDGRQESNHLDPYRLFRGVRPG